MTNPATPWTPSPAAWRAANNAHAPYAAGTMILAGEVVQKVPTPYTVALYDAIRARWPFLNGLGTRRASDRQHVVGQRRDLHEEGRGFDLGVTPSNRAAADDVANFLAAHAELLGLQGILWRGTEWYSSPNGPRWEYRPDPTDHNDHIHAEVGPFAAGMSAQDARVRFAQAVATPINSSMQDNGGSAMAFVGGLGGAPAPAIGPVVIHQQPRTTPAAPTPSPAHGGPGVLCTVTSRAQFWLRPTATFDRVGPNFPSGTTVHILSPASGTSGTLTLYRARVGTQEGFVAMNAAEVASCGASIRAGAQAPAPALTAPHGSPMAVDTPAEDTSILVGVAVGVGISAVALLGLALARRRRGGYFRKAQVSGTMPR